MDIDNLQVTDEIKIAIGRAVSSLIASGKHIEKNSILEQLMLCEKQATDGMKKTYATAIRLVTESPIGSPEFTWTYSEQ
ncbi:hypothetical protein [Enterobacter sp.]|uniref:hypothetical protein n=1 Tax=Enterobacter sp. TaxID=42895 RepID=UPI00296F313B|nr:hypothetical protein [Enterobacter sp.]